MLDYVHIIDFRISIIIITISVQIHQLFYSHLYFTHQVHNSTITFKITTALMHSITRFSPILQHQKHFFTLFLTIAKVQFYPKRH